MKVEVWSDIVCPFCYIGKRKFEHALDAFEQKEDVEIIWRSYQLDPSMKPVPGGQSVNEYLADRKGVSVEEAKRMNDYVGSVAEEVGLEFKFDSAIINNTLNAHRLLHLAREEAVQKEVQEKLFAAYFTEGKNIGDTETLISIGENAGLDANEIRKVFESNRYIGEVQADHYAAQQFGAQGVPFFVFNNKYAVSGAQATEVFADILNKVWHEDNPEQARTSDDDSCALDGDCR